MAQPTRYKPYLSPLLKKLKRGPAVTLPKDAGLIIAYTCIGKESEIVELGTGSGFLTVQLANIAKKVTTYERREEFAKTAESNFKKLEMENIELKLRDAHDGIDEKNVDLVMIDLPDAEKAAKPAYDSLKEGGFIAAHCLHLEQARLLAVECQKYFSDVFMIEGLVREYEIKERGTRPRNIGLMHTAYLVFARK